MVDILTMLLAALCSAFIGWAFVYLAAKIELRRVSGSIPVLWPAQ
jgi:hypothetical protein